MKKKIIIFIMLFWLVNQLTGCATTEKYKMKVNRWRGENINTLIEAWGFPDNTIRAPSGNKVYVYKYRVTGRYPRSYIPGNTTVTTGKNRTYVNTTNGYYVGGGRYDNQCTTWFEVNKKEIIIMVTFRGNDCVAT